MASQEDLEEATRIAVSKVVRLDVTCSPKPVHDNLLEENNADQTADTEAVVAAQATEAAETYTLNGDAEAAEVNVPNSTATEFEVITS